MIGELKMAAWKFCLGHVAGDAALLPDMARLRGLRSIGRVTNQAFRIIARIADGDALMRIVAAYATDALVAPGCVVAFAGC